MEPPVDPPVHPGILAKVQDPPKERKRCQNHAQVLQQGQVLHHILWDHLETQFYAQHVVRIVTGVRIVPITISVTCVR